MGKRFVQEMEWACRDEAIVKANCDSYATPDAVWLSFKDVAKQATVDIEHVLTSTFELADLDVHSLTEKLFPDQDGTPQVDHQDYITTEMKNLEAALEQNEARVRDIIRTYHLMGKSDGKHGKSDSKLFQEEKDPDKKMKRDKKILVRVMQSEESETMVKYMISDTDAAIKRCLSLSAEADRQRNCQKLLELLMDKVTSLIDTSLEAAALEIPREGKQKSVKDFELYFELVHQVEGIMTSLRKQIRSMCRKLSDWQDMLESVNERVGDLGDRAQASIGEGLKLCMSGMLARITRQFAEMQPPKSEDYLHTGKGSTATCDKICETLATQFEFMTCKLRGKAQVGFLRSYISKIYKVLVEHLTTLKFSPHAINEFTTDIKNYTTTITCHIPDTPENSDIKTKIEVLNDVHPIFTLRVSSLKPLIEEGQMRMMDTQTLVKFVKCRKDYTEETHEEHFAVLFKWLASR